ncbi:WD40 repeat domain-containing protein [Cylindrospermum sp. FACHB-282]|uniref:WD40 repeat domain-containing protein n=1 Tax=Cylindrospermum sp. FACHB-282 TaxID=2692794 RepID=UPI0028158A39|nr:hypothetical protein [Cylindrospermum sp. FACHB-282]
MYNSRSISNSTVKLWQVTTREQLYTLGSHNDWVNSVAFSPDGKIVVSGSRDMRVKIWRCDVG